MSNLDSSAGRDNNTEATTRKILGYLHGTMSFTSLFLTGFELLRGPEIPYGMGLLAIAWLVMWGRNTSRLYELTPRERVKRAGNMFKGIGIGTDPRAGEDYGDRPAKKRGRKGPRRD